MSTLTKSALNWISLMVVLALAGACGGGGGGPVVTPPTVNSLGVFRADLQGGLEVVVEDGSAHASALVELQSDGGLHFAVAGQPAWAGDVTGLHIHRGLPGANGPIVVDLLGQGAAFDAGSATVEGAFSIAPSLAAEIATSPQSFYVNVHTTAAPAGLARAPLAALASIEWHAVLRGGDEVVVADAAARGAAALRVGADASLSWVLAMAAPVAGDILNAHVHTGGAGANGAVLVDLGVAASLLDAAAGTRSGSASPGLLALARVLQDPAGHYVNVHSAAAPGGVARGQLATGSVELWAPLRGDRETTVVNAAARGGLTLQLTSFTAGRAILAVPTTIGIFLINGAHVHLGGPGADGPIVIDLKAGADFSSSVATGSAEGAVALDAALYARLLARPGAFYANFHTASAPNGLVRGQLTQSPQTLVASLTGNAETVVTNPSASGTAQLLLTGIHAAACSITMTSPPAGSLTSALLHDGAPGFDGPQLIDLFAGSPAVSGSTVSGQAGFTGSTFARLLANAPGFYLNVYTAAALTGAARGQMTLLADDVPPTGLTYTSPVTYTTSVAITPNTPTSGGGGVASYSVSPALPAGLSLNAVTGAISGTPTAPAAVQGYTVTATNAAGIAQAVVSITVNVGAPANLSYTTPVTCVVGTAIPANTPASTGGAIASYSVSPALPGGLTLNTTTGVISGTPTASASAADYTVTGSNVTSSTTATVNIKVDAVLVAPSGLSYSTPVTYATGTAITANTPTIGGGPVDSWSISPALTAGLSFSTSTGVISGKPTAVAAATTYTVTATNTIGSTQATLSITVNLGAPAGLSYSNTPNISYLSYGGFTTMSASSTGGDVASYSITPALPSGITLDTTTGAISGAPTVTLTQTTFTVTATNATGSTNATVAIIIYP